MPEPQKHKVELLAPAGGPDALVAAINNGADAVYLGLGDLNARRSAANFTLETFEESARFAHLRGSRVYLTANVVVLPGEFGPALSMIDAAWAAGADAVIIQDLGLLRAVRATMPEVRIHASTQIDAMNPDSVRALASAGVSRVTLARELSIEAIAACAGAGVEVESFVHGAICYSYSGQCLMSSLIGRRSANRGMCAQPCRLTYDLVDAGGNEVPVPGRYLLSAKDLAGIEHLPALAAAGVRALKIEGRMKSPEYVAIVTSVYRAALDRALADPDDYRVTQTEWEMLEEAFSRGFTDGYLTDKRGEDLMSYGRPNNRGVLIGRIASVAASRARVALDRALDSEDTLEIWTGAGRFTQSAGSLAVAGTTMAAAPAGATAEIVLEGQAAAGDRVFRVANAALLNAARRTFTTAAAHEHRAATVDFEVKVRIGEPLGIAARTGDVRVEVHAGEVGPARTKAIAADEIIEHVGRLGGSDYRAGAWTIDLDAGAGLGFSALHALRREALALLDETRLAPWSERHLHVPKVPSPGSPIGPCRTPLLVASAWDLDVARACLKAGADRVMVRVWGPDAPVAESDLPSELGPLLPRVIWPDEMPGYDTWMSGRTITAGNLGSVGRADAGVPVEADWPLNVLNAHAAAALSDLGAQMVWASPELSGRQLAELARTSPVPVGCLVWGRIEMMVSEQCVLQASGPCGRRCHSCQRREGWWRLRDRKGYEFPVTTDPSGRSHIMNSATLDLTRALDEIVAAGVAAIRLDFSDEGSEQAAAVVRAVRSALTGVVAHQPPPTEPIADAPTSGHFYRGVL